MQAFSTTAILLRQTDFGDNDLILTFFTPDRGKLCLMAKSAKKSRKRFSGSLELFSVSKLVCKKSKGSLMILQESSLQQSFISIRSDIKKTAYASYWAELINEWSEEGEKQPEVYHLFYYILEALNQDIMPVLGLNILFQMKFLNLSGFSPNLTHCVICKTQAENIKEAGILFDLAKGGLICQKCLSHSINQQVLLSKGTLKQLIWLENADFAAAGRIRFTGQSLHECQNFLEAFVPYHLEKYPKSLKFIYQLREQ